jgi:hypothetical protein
MTLLDYAKDIFSNPEKYAKFWVAVGGFVVSLITTYFADAEWLPAFVSALSAIGVFSVPNKK